MYLFETLIPYWIIIILVLLFYLYKWSVAKHKHFETLGVAHDKPLPFFGTFKDLFLLKTSHSKIFVKQYKKYKHRSYFGIYEHRKPVLVITDPSLIRRIAVSDFNYFVNHDDVFNETCLLGLSLRMMKGSSWRNMRSTLEPIFSSQKVRFMSYLIEESCTAAIGNLKNLLQDNETIEMNILDFFTRFILDVGAATTLGMKPNSLSSVDNIFYKKMKGALDTLYFDYMIYFLYGNFPSLLKLLDFGTLGYSYISYFHCLVKEIIQYRTSNNIKRFDIIQLLLDKRMEVNDNEPSLQQSPSDDEIVAQCFTVMFDGLVKSSLVAGCAAVELAANPNAQNKLHDEIDRFRELTKSQTIPYDVLEEMSYLDMVVFETLRKWPAMYLMDRLCTRSYTLYDKAGTHSINLKPGDSICIPIVALHKDPYYFPYPEKFWPERFSEDRRGFIKPYTFLPFGVGPRNCIGSKFGLMQIKASLVCLLSEFRLELKFEDHEPVLTDKKGFVMEPDKKFILRLRSRNEGFKAN